MTQADEHEHENVKRVLWIASQERPELIAGFIGAEARRQVWEFSFEGGGKRLFEKFSDEEIEDRDRESSLRQRIRRLAI